MTTGAHSATGTPTVSAVGPSITVPLAIGKPESAVSVTTKAFEVQKDVNNQVVTTQQWTTSEYDDNVDSLRSLHYTRT